MAEVNPAEISAILKKQLSKHESSISLDEIGSVLNVGDGIARVYGLFNAQYGELVEFSNGTQGIVLNLVTHLLALLKVLSHNSSGVGNLSISFSDSITCVPSEFVMRLIS